MGVLGPTWPLMVWPMRGQQGIRQRPLQTQEQETQPLHLRRQEPTSPTHPQIQQQPLHLKLPWGTIRLHHHKMGLKPMEKNLVQKKRRKSRAKSRQISRSTSRTSVAALTRCSTRRSSCSPRRTVTSTRRRLT